MHNKLKKSLQRNRWKIRRKANLRVSFQLNKRKLNSQTKLRKNLRLLRRRQIVRKRKQNRG
jgi:hypothetical protein